MTNQLANLTTMQQLFLSRLCLAGSSHASRALQAFVGPSAARIDVFDAGAVPLQAATRSIHISGEPLLGVFFDLFGQLEGHLSMVLDRRSACALAEPLVGGQPVLLPSGEISVDASAALAEVGNIVASAFLNVFADALRTSCIPSPPMLHFETDQDLVTRLEATGLGSQAMATTLEAGFKSTGYQARGQILFIPGAQLLQALLDVADRPPQRAGSAS